jgi:hypothetical protein
MKTKIIRFWKAILFCLIIVLSSCEKYEDDTGANSLMTIRKSFDKNDFSQIIKFDYEVNWNSMKNGYSPDLNSEVFEFEINKQEYTPSNPKHKAIYYKLIVLQKEGDFDFYIEKFADEKNNQNSLPSFLDCTNYSGKIYILNKSEEIVLAKKYSDGSFVGYIDVSNDKGSMSSLLQQDCHIETVNHYSEYYVTVGGYTYYNSSYLGTTYERVCHSNGTDGSDDGGGGGGGDGGVSDQYEDVDPEPCEKMKGLIDSNNPTNIKPQIDWLKTKVNAAVNNKEFGVEVQKHTNYDGTTRYEYNQVTSANEFSVQISTGGTNIGGAHSHPDNGYAMFSFGDVKFLLDAYDDASSTRKDDVFYTVVCKDNYGIVNTYTLRVNDIETLRFQVSIVMNGAKYNGMTDDEKLKLIHDEQSINYANSNGQLEKSFLQQFGSLGVSLYKADKGLSEWDKLELSDGTNNAYVMSNPCN